MLSPQLRQRVFSLWTLFWASGMTNPLVAIEQITYFLFLKQLEDLDRDRQAKGLGSIYAPRTGCDLDHHADDGKSGRYPPLPAADPSRQCTGHETCRWSYIKQNPDHDLISRYVFPWLRQIDRILLATGNTSESFEAIGSQMEDAYFQFPKDKAAALQNAVNLIDTLFPTGSVRSANDDLLGDIFEYLLSEIQTAGKNGQFRTPRHIIRFMIELLNPDKGESMVDPAAGTCGFPINTLLHVRKRYTTKENLVLEWDGTPHRTEGLSEKEEQKYFTGNYFTAFDNDRTMVRIGWMNMVLRGIESPRIERRDALGRQLPPEEREHYAYALSNPPYTGNVDRGDLDLERFPPDPRKSTEPITTKSELLFVWLLLDLLEEGGRGAVIVPEGLLFGSTNAHVALRRELLFQHRLEGVISLPAGVFQPYTGVKTSILVFQKYTEPPADGGPRTEHVWFYEVEADGYTLDAKRTDKPEPNDLWDALAKWPDKLAGNTTYYQPRISEARWRHVDDDTLKLFPNLASEQGQRSDIHELFPELPEDPTEADRQVIAAEAAGIADLYAGFLLGGRKRAQEASEKQKDDARRRKAIADLLTGRLRTVNRWFEKATKEKLDGEFEQHGRKALAPLRERAETLARKLADDLATAWTQDKEYLIQVGGFTDEGEPLLAFREDVPPLDDEALGERQVGAVVLEFAKLDGYDVKLRTPEVYAQPEPLTASKSWTAPVRVLAQRDDWELKDAEGKIILHGSHDETGEVRPAYLDYLRTELSIFDADGMVKQEFLDRLTSDCIETNNLNLSAGRYKPISISLVQHDPPAQIIRELQSLEERILTGLSDLRAKVESAA